MILRGMIAFMLVLFASAASAQTTVIVVRHAEKAEAPANDPPLTDAGRARAERLAELLKDAGITSIYSTDYARTRDTGMPLANKLGTALTITPISGNTAQFTQALAARIKQEQRGKTVLVVGHSNTVPELVKALGAAPVPPISDPEYDHLFIVTINLEGKAAVIRARF